MKSVGVIGGGQLASMLASAAQKLGIKLVVQTPSPNDPAVAFASETIFASIDDAAATAKLATRCDVITFENEFVNLAALTPLAQQGVCFRPGLQVLSPLLDKYDQRCYLKQLNLPVPKFVALDCEFNPQAINNSLLQAGLKFPLVLKARRHGYDGQGTFIIQDIEALQQKLAPYYNQQEWQSLLLLEEFIEFERELAIIAARSPAGEIVTYPVVETQQEEQVCRRVFAPADISLSVTAEVEAIAHTLLNSLQAVGIFGIELFLTSDHKVLVNEIAPRTHNSGHFSLDACETSQFEQHLRAICDLPLGNPALVSGGAVMVNLLGYEYAQNDYIVKRQQISEIERCQQSWLALKGLHVHWYGKSESRPGRKMGHVTVLLDSGNSNAAMVSAQKIESLWYGNLEQ